MNGYGTLAYTGGAIAVGGTILDQMALVGIATGLVLVGALMIRLRFRRGKTPLDI